MELKESCEGKKTLRFLILYNKKTNDNMKALNLLHPKTSHQNLLPWRYQGWF